MGPNTRVTVCLQLEGDSRGILARILVVAQPEGAFQILDVVAVLVCRGVLLCERTVGTTELAQIVEEADVQVRGGVPWAVERASVRAGVAAARVHAAFEDGHRRFGELGVCLGGQHFSPGGVQRAPGGCCAAVVVLVG